MNQIILKDKIHPFKEWIISKDDETGHPSAFLELVGDWQSVISVVRKPGLKTYHLLFETTLKLWPLYLFYHQHHDSLKTEFSSVEEGMDAVQNLLVRYNKLLCFA